MRHLAATAALALALSGPALAQDDKSDGLSLMEQGAEMFLRGLMSDLDPVLEDFKAMAEEFGPKMQALMSEMGPKLAELADKLDDIAYYEAPELLPNGDIIIRRKPDAPAYQPPQDTEIEL